MARCYSQFDTPIGRLIAGADDNGLFLLGFRPRGEESTDHPVLEETKRQLSEYFSGQRQQFDIPLSLGGTEFQRAVWNSLLQIPYGATRSYGQQAETIGMRDAVRAVGAANGENPVAIIIPCHRVIGSDGKLTGYGGGLWRKKWLLEHEQGILPIF